MIHVWWSDAQVWFKNREGGISEQHSNIPSTRIIFNDEQRPLSRTRCIRRVHSHRVVLRRKYRVPVQELHERRVGPVQVQAAAVERPLEVRIRLVTQTLQRLRRTRQRADIERQVRHQALVRLVPARRGLRDVARGRWVGGTTAVVSHDAQHARGVEVGRARINPAAAEPVVAGGGGGGHHDVVPLADGDEHAVGCVGLDGDEVVRDHGQVVPVNGELEVCLRGNVDEANEVALAGSECGFVPGAEDTGTGLFMRMNTVSVETQRWNLLCFFSLSGSGEMPCRILGLNTYVVTEFGTVVHVGPVDEVAFQLGRATLSSIVP